MIRRPPRSTLFPTRRSSDLARVPPEGLGDDDGVPRRRQEARSEEHTSELQSPCNLVCRLLLEKKKTPATQPTPRQTLSTSRHADGAHRTLAFPAPLTSMCPQ